MANPDAYTKTERLLRSIANAGRDWIEDSFWMGDGDDLLGRLLDEDWSIHRFVASYYWVMHYGPPWNRRYISYTEGDITFGDNLMCGNDEPNKEESNG